MSAGFRWTVSSQPRVLVLNKPMAFEPAPAHRKNRWAVDSLDYSAREVISIASGRMEVEATIKFEKNAQGLVDMLRDAADGNVVTYYPDLSNGTGYALWLVSESTELAPQAGNWSLGNYEVRTRWRDASASGTSIAPLFERLLFRLDAGHFPLGYIFTRSGTVGPYIDSDGVLKSAAENVARIEWVDLDGDGTRETPGYLGEGAGTNLCLQSENFGTTWAATGTPTRSAGAHTASGVSLDLLGDDDGAVIEFYSQTITFTGDGTKAISWFAKEGTGPSGAGSQVLLRDTSANQTRMGATITWSDAVPSVVMVAGSEVLEAEPLAGGVYRFFCAATGVVAANTNSLRVYPASSVSAANTGNIYIGGMQAENREVPSSYAATTTGTVTKNADTLTVPLSFSGQTLSSYQKLRVRTPNPGGIGFSRLYEFGDTDTGNAGGFGVIYSNSTAHQIIGKLRYGTGTNDFAQVAITVSGGFVMGDMLETLLIYDRENDTIDFQVSKNGAAVQAGTQAAVGGKLSSLTGPTGAIGSDRAGGTNASNLYLSHKIVAGTHSMAEMRAL